MLTSNRSCWIAFIPTVDYSQAIDDTGKFVVFYPDYGFQEVVCRSKIIPIAEELMKTPFLANHCVLAGFDKDKTRQPTEVETALMASKLGAFETVRTKVVRKDKEGGFLVVLIEGLEELQNAKKGEVL